MPQNKVLIIAYYFPPSGGSGVQRTLKFVKYLRDFGWEPVVLTAQNADYPAYDEELLAEIPRGVKVYKSKIIEPYRLYRKFTGRAQNESADIATLTKDSKTKQKLSERISEFIRSALFVPDARMLWYFFAVSLGKKIIKQEHIQAIYSSAPPYTTHLIARKLALKSGLPWIADFRDSWIGWLSTPQWRPWLSRAIEKRMERNVLRDADKILTVSNGVKNHLLSRHNHLDDNRWEFLPNGFDADDFKDITPVQKDSRITITYTGSLYGNRNPEYLLQALEDIHMSSPQALDNLLFRFVGRVGDPILQRINMSPVNHLFETIPYVTHNTSLSYLLATDYSLLIIDDAPGNEGILTGKIFEYIGAKKPIFALAPEGDATELIKSQNLGYIAHPKNVSEIKNILEKILTSKTTDSNINSENYERRHLTGQLVKVLDTIVKNANE